MLGKHKDPSKRGLKTLKYRRIEKCSVAKYALENKHRIDNLKLIRNVIKDNYMLSKPRNI